MNFKQFRQKIISVATSISMLMVGIPLVSVNASAERPKICFDVSEGSVSIIDSNFSGYGPGGLKISGTKEDMPSVQFVLLGTTTTNTVTVSGTQDIVFNNLNIDVSKISKTCAFKVADDNAGNVTITLEDGSVNTLKSGDWCAGLQKNGSIETIGTLTIQGGANGTGELTAKGGKYGAGIGGGNAESASNITISGGTVTATGGSGGAGIGGGWLDSGTNITITGGTITINSGNLAAGIGGGYKGNGSNITISGGTVTTRGYGGAGIGGGSNGSGSDITISGGSVTVKGGSDSAGIGGGNKGSCSNVIINGGSVKVTARENANVIGGGRDGNGAVIPTNGTSNVYLLTLANPSNAAVQIDGVSYTPNRHSAEDTNLYVYLTGTTHEITIGGVRTKYNFDTATVQFIAANPTSSFSSSSVTKTYGDFAFSAGFSTNSDGTVSYSSSNTSVATVASNGTITIKGAGTTTITASTPATAEYNADTKSMTLTVNKASTSGSVLTYTKQYGEAAFTASVTGSAGTVTWTSSNTSVATVNRSTGVVTIKGIGSTTLKASWTGNSNYKAGSAQATLTVSKGNLTVSAAPTVSAIIYGQTLESSTFSGGTVKNASGTAVAGKWSWKTPTTAPSVGSTTKYTAVFTPTSSTLYNTVSYDIAPSVGKQTATSYFDATSVTKNYGDSAFSAGFHTNSTGAVTYSSSNTRVATVNSSGKITITGVGTTTITASVAETGTIKADTKSMTLTVNKGTPVNTTSYTATLNYGQKLSEIEIGLACPVDGEWRWDSPDTIPTVTVTSANVTFHPTNTTLYNTYSRSVTLKVNKVTPNVTAKASDIIYTQTLTSSMLTKTSVTNPHNSALTVDGDLTWVNSAIKPEATGNFQAVFTPTDTTNYNPITIDVKVIMHATDAPLGDITATDIVYGQSIESSNISRTDTTVPGKLEWEAPATKPNVGTAQYNCTFTPDDTTKYKVTSHKVSVTTVAQTPNAEVTSVGGLTYEQTLGNSIITGTVTDKYSGATISGTWSWVTPNEIPVVDGSAVYSVKWEPDSPNYTSVVIDNIAQPIVQKKDTSVTVKPTASNITYGQSVSASTLTGGSGSVAGKFSWDASCKDLSPNAGTADYTVLFTPDDTNNYNTCTTTVQLVTDKYTPVVSTAPTTNSIVYGKTLGDVTISGGVVTGVASPISGSWEWVLPLSTVPTIAEGTAGVEATFTPEDTANYEAIRYAIKIDISKAEVSIDTDVTASEIVYGQSLADSTLSGNTSVDGDFVWENPAIEPIVADSETTVYYCKFVPDDEANYSVCEHIPVYVKVSKATPAISNVSASSLVYEQSLSASTISGTTDVSGEFKWNRASYKPVVADSETTEFNWTFTPQDSANYEEVTGRLKITVNKFQVEHVRLISISEITYGQTLSSASINAEATRNGDYVWDEPDYTPSAADSGVVDFTIKFIPADSDNYEGFTITSKINIGKAHPDISDADLTASSIKFGQKLSDSVLTWNDDMRISGTFEWVEPDTVPEVNYAGLSDVQSAYAVKFIPDDTDNYSEELLTCEIAVNKGTLDKTPILAAINATFGDNNKFNVGSVTTQAGAIVSLVSVDNPEYFETQPAVNEEGTEVTYTLKHDNALVDKSTVVHFNVECRDYEDFGLDLTITIVDCDHEGRTTSIINHRDATCTVDGYSGDKVCDWCGVILETGSVITAQGHVSDEGKVIVEPTFSSQGIREFRCTGCDKLLKTEVIPRLSAVDSSEDEDGNRIDRYPDGTTVVTKPDGTVITTYPTGIIKTEYPNGDYNIVFPDGTKIIKKDGITSVQIPGIMDELTELGGTPIAKTLPDGTRVIIYPDGSHHIYYPDGTQKIVNVDGTIVYVDPDGIRTTIKPNGDTDKQLTDGTVITTNGDDVTTKYPNGTTKIEKSDGTVVILYPDGSIRLESTDEITITEPDGTILVVGPDSVTKSDGTVIEVDDIGNKKVTKSDGTVIEISVDGTIKTTNPDGSVDIVDLDNTKKHIDTDGTTTITHPDGTVVVINPDGTKRIEGSDGHKEYTDEDGNYVTELPNGTVIIVKPDGTKVTKLPNGTVIEVYPDGTTIRTLPDGTVIKTLPDGTVITTKPDGTVITVSPDGTRVIKNPDGSEITILPDGTVVTTDEDGVITEVNPGGITTIRYPDGTVVIKRPDGTVITTYPDGSKKIEQGKIITVIGTDQVVTITAPGGIVVIKRPGEAPEITGGTLTADGLHTAELEDGFKVIAYPDGTIATVRPEGDSVIYTPGGVVISPDNNDTKVVTGADGTTVITKPNGDTITYSKDGTKVEKTGDTTTTTTPEGTVIISSPDETKITLPDGTEILDGVVRLGGLIGSVNSIGADSETGGNYTYNLDGLFVATEGIVSEMKYVTEDENIAVDAYRTLYYIADHPLNAVYTRRMSMRTFTAGIDDSDDYAIRGVDDGVGELKLSRDGELSVVIYDGSTAILKPDGTIVIIDRDGTQTTVDDSIEVAEPNDSVVTVDKDGKTSVDQDGNNITSDDNSTSVVSDDENVTIDENGVIRINGNPIEIHTDIVAIPVISPHGDTFIDVQTVTITSATDGATIYYTMDGTTPTTSSIKYTGAITIDKTTTIKAIAVKDGMTDSKIATAEFIINLPVRETVATPVITPHSGTFTDSQTVTITCETDDAKIYYTTDGTEPTASSKLYEGAFTVSVTTTVKAIAVKDEMGDSEVATETFTKKSSGGSGGSGGSSGGSGGGHRPTTPTEPSNPSINDSSKSWSDVAADLRKLTNGSKATIELNGNTTVPVDVIKAIADKKLKATFIADSIFSWIVDGAEITTPAAADLSILKINKLKTDTLRGILGIQFTMNNTNIPTDLEIAFKTEHAGKFANLYKSVDDKLTFITCAKVGTDGKVILPDVVEKGDYVVMLCEFSDLLGDMNNDGVLNAMDASAILKDIVGIEAGKNPLMADFNGDGTMNAMDASAILKRIVGIA